MLNIVPPDSFEARWEDFRKMVGELLQENKTMYGLIQSKTQELDILTKVFSNADMLTEALGRVAPERLLPEHRLPPPDATIKADLHKWEQSKKERYG